MGWVALAQQLADQPSPRLLVESPVPVELPEALQLPGRLFIGMPTQYYERPQYFVSSCSTGEGASSTPPSNPAHSGGVSTVEAGPEVKHEALEEAAADMPDYDMLEEVEATGETIKIEPNAFFEALTHGPTPAEAARIPPSSSNRPAVPRPSRPKQAPNRRPKRKAHETEDNLSEQRVGEQLCPWLLYSRQLSTFMETFADQLPNGRWTDQRGSHIPQELLGNDLPQQLLLFFPAQILEGNRRGQHLPTLQPEDCVGTVANWQATVRTRLHHAQEQQRERPCALVSPDSRPVTLPQITKAIDLRQALSVAAKEASTPLHVAIDFRMEAPSGEAPSFSTSAPRSAC